jgi:hypothetical protein
MSQRGAPCARRAGARQASTLAFDVLDGHHNCRSTPLVSTSAWEATGNTTPSEQRGVLVSLARADGRPRNPAVASAHGFGVPVIAGLVNRVLGTVRGRQQGD